MATQEDQNTEVNEENIDEAPEGQPQGGESDGNGGGEGGTGEDPVEPSEADFADPAEYRKALREYDRKVIANDIRKEHESQMAGILKDLKKQREGKIRLRQQLEQLAAQGAHAVQPTQPPRTATPEPEPMPQSFETPAAYARAWSEWNRKQEAQSTPQPATQPGQRTPSAPNDNALFAEWNGKLQNAMQSPEFAAAHQKVTSEGIGQFIGAPALRQIMASPVGTSIYQFLAENPAFAEEVEDSDPAEQVMKIRILESNLMTGKASLRIAPKVPPQPGVKPAQTPPKAPVPPPPVKPAAPPPAPKSRTEAKDMKEFMRLRSLENKKKKH